MWQSSISLKMADRAVLDRVIDSAVDLIRAEIEAESGGPWAAVALPVWEESPPLLPPELERCSVASHERARKEPELSLRQTYAWIPAEWESAGEIPVEYGTSIRETATRLAGLLPEDESDSGPKWVATEVCRRLMKHELENVTDDFVAYPFPGHDDDDLIADIEELAPTAARTRLAAAGLLPAHEESGSETRPTDDDSALDRFLAAWTPPGTENTRRVDVGKMDQLRIAGCVHMVASALRDAIDRAAREHQELGLVGSVFVDTGHDGLFLIPSVQICSERQHDRAANVADPQGRAAAMWVAASWEDGVTVDVARHPLSPSEVEGAQRDIIFLMANHGVSSPHRWILEEACRAVNFDPPHAGVSRDLCVFPSTGRIDDALEVSRKFVLPTTTKQRLTARGLMPMFFLER